MSVIVAQHSLRKRCTAAAVACSFFLSSVSPLGYAQTQAAPAVIKVTIDHFHEKRLALVIGNGKYKKQALINPANDARVTAKALRDLGFEVLMHVDVGV